MARAFQKAILVLLCAGISKDFLQKQHKRCFCRVAGSSVRATTPKPPPGPSCHGMITMQGLPNFKRCSKNPPYSRTAPFLGWLQSWNKPLFKHEKPAWLTGRAFLLSQGSPGGSNKETSFSMTPGCREAGAGPRLGSFPDPGVDR